MTVKHKDMSLDLRAQAEKKEKTKPDVVMNICNSSKGAEISRSLEFTAQPAQKGISRFNERFSYKLQDAKKTEELLLT